MNELNNILQELKEKKKSSNNPQGYPYTIPEHYFITLENQILLQVTTNDILQQKIPETHKAGTLFSVPDSYFHNLEKNILAQITQRPATVFAFKKWISIAAAVIVALIIVGGVFYRKNDLHQRTDINNLIVSHPSINTISMDELTDFSEEQPISNKNSIQKGQNIIDDNQIFKQVSNHDLESFLNEKTTRNDELF